MMDSGLREISNTSVQTPTRIGDEAEEREVNKYGQKQHRHNRSKRTAQEKTPTPSRRSHSPPPPNTNIRPTLLPTIVNDGLTTKGFDVIVRGVLEGAVCHSANALFAHTYWVHGRDWTAIPTLTSANKPEFNFNGTHTAGHVSSSNAAPLVRLLDRGTPAEVITQLAVRSDDPFARFTWAAPFELALHSTNPHGWPQIVVTLHTVLPGSPGTRAADGGGAPCVSYSRCFVPTRSGAYRLQLPLMQLRPNTWRQAWIEWWTCDRAELRDPSFLCSGEDRSVLRAASVSGHVALSLSVVIRGFLECGMEP